jgi:hypothetical protein
MFFKQVTGPGKMKETALWHAKLIYHQANKLAALREYFPFSGLHIQAGD